MTPNEPIKLDFGKNLGQVELKEDGGIQKGAFDFNKMTLSIFEYYNNDKNIVLDETELQKFYEDLEKAAGDDKRLTRKEAVEFLESIGIKDVKPAKARRIIKSFIDNIGSKVDMVEKTVVSNGQVIVTYKNGKEEIYTYNEDEQKSILTKLKYTYNNGGYYEVNYDPKDGKKVSEKKVNGNETKNVE